MPKPLHVGRAAQNGVVAAELAARGFTADALALEGESGFLRAAAGGAETGGGQTPDRRVEAFVRDLGAPWEIVEPGIGVKLYPCCYATHRAIDAALEAGSGSDPALTIGAIAVSVTPGTLIPLLPRPPATALEAKFSLEYCVAAALLDGRVGRDAFTDAAVKRPQVRDVMSRVQIVEAGERMNFPIEGIAEVRVTTPAGDISARVETPRGDPRRPLSWDELAAKFRDCAAEVLPAGRVENVIALIERLDELPDVRELTAVLAT
jgi:2-methylcitrate dehydratase PrpD